MTKGDESFSMQSVERLYLDRDELARVEMQYALELHYMRYHFARQIVSGVVLDIASGCGYGTYMLTQKAPEVRLVIGVDASVDAIEHANRHFRVDNNVFVCSSVGSFEYEGHIDWAVSIETIEHLDKPEELVRLCQRQQIGRVLLTHPTRKTTHYNKYHLHDFKVGDMEKLFAPDYQVVDRYQYHREFIYIVLEHAGDNRHAMSKKVDPSPCGP